MSLLATGDRMRRFLPPLAAVLALLLLWGGRAAMAAPLAPATQVAASTMLQGCPTTIISSPRPGATLRGEIPVIGSANADRFQFYKLEFAPASNPQAWSAVSSTINRPIANGQLDVWNTQAVPDGVYNLKLTVVDDRAQEVCWFVASNVQVANRVQAAAPTQAQASPTPNEAETPTPDPRRTATPQATVTPPVLPTLPPLPGGTPAAVALAQATAAATARPGTTPTAVGTPRGTGTPGASATPAARSGLSSLIPDFSGIRRQFTSAFDVGRIRDAFLLGAIGTLAVFAFIGLVVLLRKLI